MSNFYNKVYNNVNILHSLAERYKINKPYFVGGTPRDFSIGQKIEDMRDLDITTLNSDCGRLGLLFAIKNQTNYKIFLDKHVSIPTDFIGLDFSGNVENQNVKDWMISSGKDIKFVESFSRDFTINSMHQDMFSDEIFDPTDGGIRDINNKIIRTPAPVSITLGNDKRRIFRAIKLAVQFNFNIDGKIIDWVVKNYSNDTSEDDFSRTAEINKAILINADMTYSIIKNMKLEKKIPLVGPYKDYIIANNLVLNNLTQ
jgi:hypothetical protein